MTAGVWGMTEPGIRRAPPGVPTELLVFTAFCILVSVWDLSFLVAPSLRSLQERVIPYTGWNFATPYLFLIYFLMRLCRRTIPRPLIIRRIHGLMLILGSAFGIVDYFYNHKHTWPASNPYLSYAPERPFIRIALPILWAVLLFSPRITRYLQSSAGASGRNA